MAQCTSRTRGISAPSHTAALIALITGTLSAQDSKLEAGIPVVAALSFENDDHHDYSLEIPAGARLVEIELVCRIADLDLFLGDANCDPDEEDWMLTGESHGGREVLELDHHSIPDVQPGSFRVRVACNLPRAPIWKGRPIDRLPYELKTTIVRQRIDASLRPGSPIEGILDDDCGRFRTYRLDVPASAAAIRIDVTDTPGDVDLFLRRDGDDLDPAFAPFAAEASLGCETLLVTAHEASDGLAGTWYVDVAEWFGRHSTPIPFRVQLSFRAEPPDTLQQLPIPPRPPEGASGLAAAVPSIVEVFSATGSGTGTIVREDGVIITCAHVLADLGEEAPLDDVVVAINRDIALPPVETFRGRVVEFDIERDIAIVKIDRSYYGTPLPADYRFPALPVASESPGLGTPLRVLGYSVTGGTGTRTPITCTRGIVAGYERRDGHTMIKTDAAVHSGQSGGTGLDEQGRLVAIPVETQTDDDVGEIAYLYPILELPAAWRTKWIDTR